MGQQRTVRILWPESLGGADTATSEVLPPGMSPCLGSRIPGTAGGAMGNVGTGPSLSPLSLDHSPTMAPNVHLIGLPKLEIFWPISFAFKVCGCYSVRLFIFAPLLIAWGFDDQSCILVANLQRSVNNGKESDVSPYFSYGYRKRMFVGFFKLKT